VGIVAVAMAGKLGGCMLAARFMGMNWNESFALGALMNIRGLVELIALNIGYDPGILPPRIFTNDGVDGVDHDIHGRAAIESRWRAQARLPRQ
jgi:sodium/hydrogen exchanger family protein